MKKILSFFTILVSLSSIAQTPEEFTVEIEPITIANAPGVHSYSFGITDDQKWVVLGGRVDGLHQRQPFAAFLEQDNNKNVFVIDPINELTWSADLSVLPTSIFEQLQSTNQEFHQEDTMLYAIGGYGRSNTSNDHITFPNLTAISINQLADAVINGDDITPYFRQITDANLKVTGGQLGYLNGTYYLVGGHLFDGRYNPVGPDHGPGFIQQYTNEIRTFEINDDGVNLSISNYTATNDTVNLHRRDYNIAPQIFPNGDVGFTAFSGVFDYSDMPYLNTVDVTPGNYAVNNTFNQYLSQYHSATIPLFDANANTMHTLFFGGLSQFTLDNQNNLVEDIDVPFVKTISKVSRFSNGDMQEVKLGYVEMPTLVGPGAEFIPIDQYFDNNDILDLNAIPQSQTLIGYIYGGIESSAENIFFVNDGNQSFASNVIFKVYLNKSTGGQEEISITDKSVLNLNIYPNPVRKMLTISCFGASHGEIDVTIISTDGGVVQNETIHVSEIGTQEFKVNLSGLSSGSYILKIDDGVNQDQKTFVKK